MKQSRRKFVKDLSIATSAIPLLSTSILPFSFNIDHPDSNTDLDIHIFSKHLQFLDYEETGAMAAEMGFSGVDLTVRPKGHVLPESVSQVLPKAIRAIKKGGSQCKLITTNIQSADNSEDRDVIISAAKSGVEYYRTGWYKYDQEKSMIDSLASLQQEVKKLGAFNKEHKIIACYQNHAGTGVGSSFWEIQKLLEQVDSNYFGTQYDIRHAIAEGGLSWENGFRLLHQNIKTIVLKDFVWGKEGGEWKPINVPIGEGMVDFIKYFKLLKKYKINVPVSLHLEYPLGGAEKGHYEISVDKKVIFDAMIKDLTTIRKLWKEA